MAHGSPMRRRAGIAIATLLLAAGCGDPPTDASTAPSGPAITCVGVPAGACARAVENIGSNGSRVPPAAMRVTCTAPFCSHREGAVTIDVVYADGTRSSSGYGWAAAAPAGQAPGPPALTVVPTCIGIDRQHCQSLAQDAQGERPVPPRVRSIIVTCTAVCGAVGGTGTTVISYDDGTSEQSGWSYDGVGPVSS
jgi:hypothetical protein